MSLKAQKEKRYCGFHHPDLHRWIYNNRQYPNEYSAETIDSYLAAAMYTKATTAEVLNGPSSQDSSAADEHKSSTTDNNSVEPSTEDDLLRREQNKLLLAGMSLPATKIDPATYADVQVYLQGIPNSKFDDIRSYTTECLSTPGEPAQDQAAQFTYTNNHDIRAHANALLRETDKRAAHSYPGRRVPTSIKIH